MVQRIMYPKGKIRPLVAIKTGVGLTRIPFLRGKIALMVLKAYTGFSDRLLVEHLNGNIHYQLFCGIMIAPSCPITNYKIISAVRNEIASRLDIGSLQKILASHLKPYLENLHVCMTDATCYESHMRFPTDMKLLWESLEWLYRHICIHCGNSA